MTQLHNFTTNLGRDASHATKNAVFWKLWGTLRRGEGWVSSSHEHTPQSLQCRGLNFSASWLISIEIPGQQNFSSLLQTRSSWSTWLHIQPFNNSKFHGGISKSLHPEPSTEGVARPGPWGSTIPTSRPHVSHDEINVNCLPFLTHAQKRQHGSHAPSTFWGCSEVFGSWMTIPAGWSISAQMN